MAITLPSHEGPREAVLVLKSFRAVTGQEFHAGWTCGFHPSVVDELVSRGFAKRVAQPVAEASLTEKQAAESAVTGGDTAAASEAASDAAPASEPTEGEKANPRRKAKK